MEEFSFILVKRKGRADSLDHNDFANLLNLDALLHLLLPETSSEQCRIDKLCHFQSTIAQVI